MTKHHAGWAQDLGRALAVKDESEMRAALEHVPAEVMQRARPYIEELARACVQDGRLEESLVHYGQLLQIEPDNVSWLSERARVHLRLDLLQEALADASKLTQLQPQLSAGHRLLAEAHDGLRNRREALSAYEALARCEPGDAAVNSRIAALREEVHKQDLLKAALDPNAAAEQPKIEWLPPPRIVVEPASFVAPEIPTTLDARMVEGLKRHLQRYGSHQSSRSTLERLEDPAWLAAWDAALAATADKRVLCHGSELGVFALRALAHGATQVTAVETSPLDARLASGNVYKELAAQWRSQHAEQLSNWSEEQQRDSFSAFSQRVQVVAPDAPELAGGTFDCCVFPNLDHGLLSTGIAKTVREYRARGLPADARILPGRARLYACGIQWRYPGSDFDLQPLARLRWHLYPQPLECAPDCFTVLTDVVPIGSIELAEPSAALDIRLPVIAAGQVDAIVFWFDLELGETTLVGGFDTALRCLRPATQHVDARSVVAGEQLAVHVSISETRVYFQTDLPPSEVRQHTLPSWYVPMLVDAPRNAAYQQAIAATLQRRPISSALDIGAGSMLLSMMAARAGVPQVYACEVDAGLCSVAEQILARNGCSAAVRVINKDCRKLSVPTDLPQRAELGLFELFDCGLLGEGVLHFLAHAREHLLAPHASLVPMAARLRGQLIEYRFDKLWGFDVNLLNPYLYSPSYRNVDAAQLHYRPLSAPFDLFAFDFATAGPTPGEMTITAPAIAPGVASAVLFWFDLRLDEHQWLSNAPGAVPALHWQQALQFLPEVNVSTDTAMPLVARHDGSGVVFQWQEGAFPKESLSRLPRFDPRWMHEATQLQQQTAELFRHCMGDPSEYRRVGQLATLLAIDPAAHGIDPRIAQRFAARLLR